MGNEEKKRRKEKEEEEGKKRKDDVNKTFLKNYRVTIKIVNTKYGIVN